MRRHPAINEKGFTMIEVIVSLILIGIMGVIAGMGFVAITKGYIFSKQNNETSLRAQVAMAKIVKEIGMQSINFAVTVADVTAISYRYTDPIDSTIKNHTIALSGTQIQFDGIRLVDNVNSLVIDYYDCCSATKLATPVSAADRLKIRRVDISFGLTGAVGIISNFTDSAKIQEAYY